MRVIIRRKRRPERGRIALLAGAAGVVALGAALALAWNKGAPVPVHEMVVNLPVPAGPSSMATQVPE